MLTFDADLVCIQVLLAVGSSLVVVDADSATDQGLTEGPFMSLSAAPSGKFLAGLTAGGRLIVWLADLSKVLPTCGLLTSRTAS